MIICKQRHQISPPPWDTRGPYSLIMLWAYHEGLHLYYTTMQLLHSLEIAPFRILIINSQLAHQLTEFNHNAFKMSTSEVKIYHLTLLGTDSEDALQREVSKIF